ncbi:MAG: alkyl sulfatase C-terminal domain-containing protein [Candidatus Promineifilaceae bacterium]|nr:alkyl sulfatase C-terminal domain-containing protein [Candidatus Promineifilaceae bacterium]
MHPESRHEIETFWHQLEEMWGHLSHVFDVVAARSAWDQPHGPDWTMAEVPYHLAYCNWDVVARGLQLGRDYPPRERELITTAEELTAWHWRKFGERWPTQTAVDSVIQWRISCDSVQQQLAAMDDADLEQPAWMPLMMGWTTKRHLLTFSLTHDWSALTQLRIHLGLRGPIPSPAITRAYLAKEMKSLAMRLAWEAAVAHALTVVMAFTDPGVGAWTIAVADGQATVRAGAADDADLVLTQSSETFEKTLRGIQEPAEAIRSGDVRVSDPEALSLFAALFPSQTPPFVGP